jgi:hypothetical protein
MPSFCLKTLSLHRLQAAGGGNTPGQGEAIAVIANLSVGCSGRRRGLYNYVFLIP